MDTKPLKRVSRKQMQVVDIEGRFSLAPVTLWLDPRGDQPTFIYELPDYLVKAMGGKDYVAALTGEKAKNLYEEELRKYSYHVKTNAAVPVIIITALYQARDEQGRKVERNSFFDFRGDHIEGRPEKSGVAVGYTLAFRIGDKVHSRERVNDWDADYDPNQESQYRPGYVLTRHGGIVTDYTPELEQQLDNIIAVLDKAACAIDRILGADDVSAALLAAPMAARLTAA